MDIFELVVYIAHIEGVLLWRTVSPFTGVVRGVVAASAFVALELGVAMALLGGYPLPDVALMATVQFIGGACGLVLLGELFYQETGDDSLAAFVKSAEVGR